MQFLELLNTTEPAIEATWGYGRGDWREDVVKCVADLSPGMIRWGGNFTRYYKWKEGIGPAEKRPWMYNYYWGGKETNRVGTHEFINFCLRVGAEPLLGINFMSDGFDYFKNTVHGENRYGTLEEAVEWVSYCNDPDNRERRKKRRGNAETRKFRAFVFKDLSTGLRVGQRLMAENLQPSVIRLYNEEETKELIKRVLGIEKEGAYMVYGFDGKKEMVDLQMKYAQEIAVQEKGEDLGEEPGEEWWNNRYKFFFPPYMYRLPQCFGTLDTVATYSKIEGIFNAMRKVVKTNYPQARFIGHFSHWFHWGCMLYARFIVDNPPEDPHEVLYLHNSIWNDALRAAMGAGGVLNEHHGIGLKLSRLAPELYGNSFEIIKKLKKTLDPNGIMNPGKLGLGV